MRSKDYCSWLCLSAMTILALQAIKSGLWVIPKALVLKGLEKEHGEFAEMTVLKSTKLALLWVV